jgi:hypothetical protein
MLTKAAFTPDEWETVRDAPQYVAMAVATAGASGLFGSIREAFTAGKLFTESFSGPNELLRSLCHPEELKSYRNELLSAAADMPPEKQKTWLRQAAVDKCTQALAILSQKGSPEETSAYRDWLAGIAERIAGAAKEGGVLGFGGERVSATEREVIGEIRKALGL